MTPKKELPEAVRKHYAEIGRRNGKKLMEERGPEYFRNISKMRKVHGAQKFDAPVEVSEPASEQVEP